MSVRNIKPKELSDIIADPAELSKGIRIRDDGGLQHPARFENKLFADAKGSGASPYKVQIIYDEAENKFKGRCSCMAARSRPFCKHAVALLAAWSSAPEAFAVSEGPPQG
ncbi:MAG TPA: SWIM zinc finger family protein, partial [Leptospiraceae bacterium]|nr:SWIM zinc finger family protein [Leptospiraceae bacterium]